MAAFHSAAGFTVPTVRLKASSEQTSQMEHDQRGMNGQKMSARKPRLYRKGRDGVRLGLHVKGEFHAGHFNDIAILQEERGLNDLAIHP